MCVLVSSVSNLYPCHPVPLATWMRVCTARLCPPKPLCWEIRCKKTCQQRKLFVLDIFQLLKAFGNLLARVSDCLSHKIVIRRRRHTIAGETIFISNTFEGASGLMMKVPKKYPSVLYKSLLYLTSFSTKWNFEFSEKKSKKKNHEELKSIYRLSLWPN